MRGRPPAPRTTNMPGHTPLSTIDTRPYFEQVLQHGWQEGLIDAPRLEAMRREGAKGVVQLAAFFSTAHLRPALEAARTRLVTLVSFSLEAESGRMPQKAAALLRDRSLLALSKAGADRLRQLMALPADSLLGGEDFFQENEKQFLARYTLDEPITFARYLAERKRRETHRDQIELAYRLGESLGLPRASAQELHISAESLINSVLLVLYTEKHPRGLFSINQYTARHEAARRKRSGAFAPLPPGAEPLPVALETLLENEQERFLGRVLPLIRTASAQEISHDHERYAGLFFFDTHNLDDITHHDREAALAWQDITGRLGAHTDVQCAILLSIAAGLPPTRSLRKKDAVAIWQHCRQYPLDTPAVHRFIDSVVPFEYQADMRRMWDEDLGPEAQLELGHDKDHALDYLRQACRTSWKQG